MRFVLEPGNEMALRGLIELIAKKRELPTTIKIPFGIKSGGHISIPKIYPPNEGILISMKRFNYMNYDKEKKTLDVGAGVIWKDVYDYLKPFASDLAPGVVGGDPLVGVSGWLLGGGYSLLTNRFGLGIDNIIRFRGILPSKGVCNISCEENPEIFTALKGGGHNFGIITQFTLRVHHYSKRTPPVIKEFPESKSSLVKDILVSFIQDKTLPQAAVLLAAFRHDLKDGELKSSIPLYEWDTASLVSKFPGVREHRDLALSFFSDGSSMSLAEAYEAFSLRHLPVSLETLKTDFQSVDQDVLPEIKAIVPDANIIEKCLRSFGLTDECLLLIYRKLLTSLRNGNKIDRNSLTVFTIGRKIAVIESPPDLRGRMAGIAVTTYTRTLIDEAEKQAKKLSSLMATNQGTRVSFEIWPFHKNAFDGVSREDSAWPHEEGKVFGPLVGWFEWSGKDKDEYWLKEIAKALEELHRVALEEKCTTEDLPVYLNITLEDTSVKAIYRDHYEKLKRLRRQCDPNNVMGLAAGFVIDASEE
ncbi:hypothetical protein K438DRAFT_1722721 [Mycena galopus ATCC 62051]|nr:hypothetical protein K438DRAFT_1722721 [Mycena galopus ATCC 62051]